MAEEPPGGWELKRDVTQIRSDIRDGFAGLNKRLDDIARDSVSQREYTAYQARMDERHKSVIEDLEELDRKVERRFTAIQAEAVQGKRYSITTGIALIMVTIAFTGLILTVLRP